MLNLGLLYENQEKFDLAEKYYLMAIKENNSNAMFNLGLLYYNQEKFELALKYFEQALKAGYHVPDEYFDIIKKEWNEKISKETVISLN